MGLCSFKENIVHQLFIMEIPLVQLRHVTCSEAWDVLSREAPLTADCIPGETFSNTPMYDSPPTPPPAFIVKQDDATLPDSSLLQPPHFI